MTSRTRRRWFSFAFSLRSLFACITVLAVGTAWVAQRIESRRQLRVAATLKGRIELTGMFDDGGLSAREQSWWRELLGEAFGPRVRTIVSVDPPVDGLPAVEGFTNLRFLYLDRAQIKDLAPLARLPSLQWLFLDATQDSDLSPIAGLTSLQSLYLAGPELGDLAPLAGLTNLERLWLKGTLIEDVSPLAKLNNLQSLDLRGTQVHNVSALVGLSRLRSLDITGTPVSDEQVATLQQALPNCKIIK